MSTTQGAGLGEGMREGKETEEEGEEEGGRGELWFYVHCGLYLFGPLLFKHRKKEREKTERAKERAKERESEDNERKNRCRKKRKLRLNKGYPFSNHVILSVWCRLFTERMTRVSNERGEWPQLLSQSFAKPLPFFLSHDTRTLPQSHALHPLRFPSFSPSSPSSVCHSSIHASASLGCCEKENMMHVRNGILVLQYAVCM